MSDSLKDRIIIEGRAIGVDSPCLIVPEVGVNHNGSTKMAIEMIDAIAEAGAECVKFQTFDATEFVGNSGEYYEYLSQGKLVRESQLEMFKRLQINYEDFAKLFDHARAKGLIPLSTPADKVAADLLEEIGVGAFKIGSDDLVHTPFIEYVSKKNKPIILSTGMADFSDIERAVNIIKQQKNYEVCLLHCVSTYPTKIEDINLNNITELRTIFNCPVGFSDHSDGIMGALGSVILKASVIEKHFTLDKKLSGPDHHFSMDPIDLRNLVEGAKKMEIMLGTSKIMPVEDEFDMRKIARRSIVAAKNLPKGHVIREVDLAYRRPGSGLMPYQSINLLGKTLNTLVKEGQQLSFSHLS